MPRENDDRIVEKRFQQCGFKDCLTLERGELSHCSRGPNAYIIQGFERMPHDFVRVDASLDDIKAYVRNARFMTACRYCWGTDRAIKVTAGEQGKR